MCISVQQKEIMERLFTLTISCVKIWLELHVLAVPNMPRESQLSQPCCCCRTAFSCCGSSAASSFSISIPSLVSFSPAASPNRSWSISLLLNLIMYTTKRWLTNKRKKTVEQPHCNTRNDLELLTPRLQSIVYQSPYKVLEFFCSTTTHANWKQRYHKDHKRDNCWHYSVMGLELLFRKPTSSGICFSARDLKKRISSISNCLSSSSNSAASSFPKGYTSIKDMFKCQRQNLASMSLSSGSQTRA